MLLCCSILDAQQLRRFEYEHPQMGTTFRIILYASNDSSAQVASIAAFDRLDNLNQKLSDYLPNSEVSQLSASAGSGQRMSVSDDLWQVLLRSQEISKASKGAFDVSIGALSKLWRKAFRRQQFPNWSAIRTAQSMVNYKWIKLYPKSQRIALRKPGMRLDFGGIAKGYAVDEMMKCLEKSGIQSALVDGGGDLLVSNAPPNTTGWKIEVDNTVQYLSNQAIATSGDRYQFLEWEGKRYSHIIHPKTGLGITEQQQVTVYAANCVLADALASTFVLLNKREASQLAKKFDTQYTTSLLDIRL